MAEYIKNVYYEGPDEEGLPKRPCSSITFLKQKSPKGRMTAQELHEYLERNITGEDGATCPCVNDAQYTDLSSIKKN